MKVEYNLKGKLVFEINKEEAKELEVIKTRLEDILDKYCIEERENLDLKVAPHISQTPRIYDLIYCKTDIIKNLYYSDYYKNVININTAGHVEFINGNLFYEFANAYNLLDNTLKGTALLKNILKVKIIDWLIKNEYKEVYNVFCKIDNKDNYNRDYLDIFTPYGYELFYHLNTNYIEKHKGLKYSNIYRFMSNGKSNKFRVICSTLKYLKFIESNIKLKVSKVYSFHISYDLAEIELKKLKNEYIEINGIPTD